MCILRILFRAYGPLEIFLGRETRVGRMLKAPSATHPLLCAQLPARGFSQGQMQMSPFLWVLGEGEEEECELFYLMH